MIMHFLHLLFTIVLCTAHKKLALKYVGNEKIYLKELNHEDGVAEDDDNRGNTPSLHIEIDDLYKNIPGSNYDFVDPYRLNNAFAKLNDIEMERDNTILRRKNLNGSNRKQMFNCMQRNRVVKKSGRKRRARHQRSVSSKTGSLTLDKVISAVISKKASKLESQCSNTTKRNASAIKGNKHATNDSTKLSKRTNQTLIPLVFGDMKQLLNHLDAKYMNNGNQNQTNKQTDKFDKLNDDWYEMYRQQTKQFLNKITELQKINGVHNITGLISPDILMQNSTFIDIFKKKPLKEALVTPTSLKSNDIGKPNYLAYSPNTLLNPMYNVINVRQPQMISNLRKMDLSLLSFPPVFNYINSSSIINANEQSSSMKPSNKTNKRYVGLNINEHLFGNESLKRPTFNAFPVNLLSVVRFQPDRKMELLVNNQPQSSLLENKSGLPEQNLSQSTTNEDLDLMAELFTEKELVISPAKKDSNELHRVALSKNWNINTNIVDLVTAGNSTQNPTANQSSSSVNEDNTFKFDNFRDIDKDVTAINEFTE